MEKTAQLAIYLISCEINRAEADPSVLADADYGSLYAFASSHAVPQIVGNALLRLSLPDLPEAEKQKWSACRGKAIRRSILMADEAASVMNELENAGIRHMPLKGFILKEFYPEFWMRIMSDCDILYDEKRQKDLEKIMCGRGYPEGVPHGKTDVYQKNTSFCFEMHRALFNDSEKLFAGYYKNVEERLIPKEGSSCSFRFSDEDFYIFFIAHSYKHYSGAGTGLRTLLDFFVFNRAKRNTLNESYLNEELKKLGLTEFEKKCRILSEKLFGEPKPDTVLSEEEENDMQYFLGSGTYGTRTNLRKNEISKNSKNKTVGKIIYFWKRLFPSKDTMLLFYPVCRKHGWMLPFCYVYRIVTAPFRRGKAIAGEIKTVSKL